MQKKAEECIEDHSSLNSTSRNSGTNFMTDENYQGIVTQVESIDYDTNTASKEWMSI